MPVWPTMSALAMLQTMKSNCCDAIASTSLSVTSGQLISGLQIVGRDVRARHEDAFLAGERRFAAAGEEERHVRVFLGFGDAQLLQAERREVFAERVLHRLRRDTRSR